MDRILHPTHQHPLDLKPVGKGKRKGFNAECCVCRHRISDPVAYSCRDCRVFSHKSCAESPLPVHGHPFHPDHPLLLLHTPSEFDCPACNDHHGPLSKYGCEGCGFYLDLDCVMSASVAEEVAPPDVAAIQSYLANEHDHPLTRFFAARRRYLCSLCETGIKGEGYICLEPGCEFHAHEGCIRGLFYEDGTRIPRVAHDHQLFTHHDWRAISKCKICNLKVPGEKIGCPTCSLFYHRKCLDVPDRLDYPPHSAHPLTLSIAESNDPGETLPCRSCGGRLLHQVVYGCSHCLYFLHIACAHAVLGYLQGGTEAEIRASWHRHPLLPCHGTSLRACHSCGRSVEGLGYVCSVEECGLLLHPSCKEQSLEIKEHPHHPENPLVLVRESPSQPSTCDACCGAISGFRYYCTDCNFSLDTRCASVLPEKKHELHEHQLARFTEIRSIQCNVCMDADDSAIFRCVRCDFNIHEGCMALPPSVKHKSHNHMLHLRDSYVEDDSGVYYCEICAGRRNPELGAYVCRECKEDNLYVAHMECALSRELVVRVSRDPAIRRLEMRITELETEVGEMELVETELKEARKQRADILSNLQAQPFYNVNP